MQSNVFEGNLASAPTLSHTAKGPYCRFTLIENSLGAEDEATGERREYKTALSLVAFGQQAERIAEKGRTGDQMMVIHEVRNDNYEKNGETIYGYSFVVRKYRFGREGKAKREEAYGRPDHHDDDGQDAF